MALPTNSAGAVADLGFGANLQNQVAGETEEQRRKRMQQMQLQQSMGPAASLSVTSLFGPGGGPKGAGL